MKKLSLTKMKTNQRGKVVEILGGSRFQNKLLSMGIYEGKEILKVGHFALNGPVAVKLGRGILALGHGMAGKIILEVE